MINHMDMKRIWLFFQQKLTNNQPEISHWPRRRQNSEVIAGLSVSNIFIIQYPWFLTAFFILSSAAMTLSCQRKPVLTQHHCCWNHHSNSDRVVGHHLSMIAHMPFWFRLFAIACENHGTQHIPCWGTQRLMLEFDYKSTPLLPLQLSQRGRSSQCI